MAKSLFSLFSYFKSTWVATVLILLLAGSVLFFKTSYLERGFSVSSYSSVAVRLNTHPIDDKSDVIRCRAGDTLEIAIGGSGPLYGRILCQNDGGPLRNFRPSTSRVLSWTGAKGEFFPQRIILDKHWKRKTLYCVAARRPLPVLESISLVNRYLRKELTRDRPIIEVFYLTRKR
jgi:hypothetical protein